MSLAIRLYPEPLRTIAAGAIGVGYTAIGTAFDFPSRIFFIQNQTNALLLFSFDGVTDHFALPSQGFLLLDVTANKTVDVGCFILCATVYVKQSAVPTTGSVYLSTFYGQGAIS